MLVKLHTHLQKMMKELRMVLCILRPQEIKNKKFPWKSKFDQIYVAFPWKLCVLCLHTRLHNNHTQWCKSYTIVYEDVEYKAAIQKHHCREHSLTACLLLWKISKTIVAHNSRTLKICYPSAR
jgi:hypothetical protein